MSYGREKTIVDDRMALNTLMEFGHVVTSDGNGTVVSEPRQYDDRQLWVESVVYLSLDADGQSYDDNVYGLPDGWTLLSGFTGQDRYHGPVMHASEYVGGGLARHIRENAGHYVCLIVDGEYDDGRDVDEEDVNVGWAVAFKPTVQ